MKPALAAWPALLCLSMATVTAAEQSHIAASGHALVERMCASCHATGKTGASPHVAAPPFRTLDRQATLDDLAERLRRGLMTGHEDMPTFRFSRDDAFAVSAYIRSIQKP